MITCGPYYMAISVWSCPNGQYYMADNIIYQIITVRCTCMSESACKNVCTCIKHINHTEHINDML